MRKRSPNMTLVNSQRSIILTAEDLQEFRIRQNTLNHIRSQYLMVEEAYITWSRNLREKYKIPTTKFNIDYNTGHVTPVEDR